MALCIFFESGSEGKKWQEMPYSLLHFLPTTVKESQTQLSWMTSLQGDGEKDNSESDAGAGDDDSTDSVLHSVI